MNYKEKKRFYQFCMHLKRKNVIYHIFQVFYYFFKFKSLNKIGIYENLQIVITCMN